MPTYDTSLREESAMLRRRSPPRETWQIHGRMTCDSSHVVKIRQRQWSELERESLGLLAHFSPVQSGESTVNQESRGTGPKLNREQPDSWSGGNVLLRAVHGDRAGQRCPSTSAALQKRVKQPFCLC